MTPSYVTTGLQVLTYMKKQVPVVTLTIQTLLVNYVYHQNECSTELKTSQIVSLVVLMILTGVITAFHSAEDYAKKNVIHEDEPLYVCLQIVSSWLAFFSLSMFVFKGAAFSCFMTYDPIMSNVLFYLSCALIVTVGVVEHHFWPKLTRQSPILSI